MQFQKVVDKHNVLPGIKSRQSVVIELGCGGQKFQENAIGIDFVDSNAVDIIADINQGLEFLDDGSVDMVYSSHVLEHLNDLEFIMKEIYRVLKPGGINKGLVPHFSNPYYYSDYTHKVPFGLYSFSYFSKSKFLRRGVPQFYNSIDFEIRELKIVFYSPFKLINVFRKIFTLVFNSSRMLLEFYEGSLSTIIPAHEIKFELQKRKE